MARTTPGLDYLARNGLKPTILFITFLLVDFLLGLRFPVWTLFVSSFLGVSAFAVGRKVLQGWFQTLESTRIGVRLAPENQRQEYDVFRVLTEFWEGPCISRLWRFAGECSPIVNLHVLLTNTIITACPEHVEIMVATNPDNYVKGDCFREITSSTLGTGVFNTDGDIWKFHRSVVRPLFAPTRRTAHLDLSDRHAQSAIAYIDVHIEAGLSVDFMDLIRRSNLNSATELLFGACVSSLPSPGSSTRSSLPAMDFFTALRQVRNITSRRERFGSLWPLYELFGDQTKKPMKVISQTLDPIIRNAMGRNMMKCVGVSDYNKEIDETLLDQLAELTDKSYQIKDVILNILIPGWDNVPSTLSYIVYSLARHPNVTSRLRQEVVDYVGPSRRPNVDELKKMRYLRAVIDEALRLTSPVHCTMRESIDAATWPSPHMKQKPIFIPAHTKIYYDTATIHTSKDLWGPDADCFDPSRFIDERFHEYLAPNPYIFVPFSSGPRTCLGKEFAYDEISVMVVRLIQSYNRISLDPSSTEWHHAGCRYLLPTSAEPQLRLVLYSNEGELQVRLEDEFE